MATNTNAFSACRVITNNDSGYVFIDNKPELDMLAENSLVAIDGGSLQGVWLVTKVNAKSLQLCGAIDAQNKPLVSCDASNKFNVTLDALRPMQPKFLPGALGGGRNGWVAGSGGGGRFMLRGPSTQADTNGGSSSSLTPRWARRL